MFKRSNIQVLVYVSHLLKENLQHFHSELRKKLKAVFDTQQILATQNTHTHTHTHTPAHTHTHTHETLF